MKKLFLPFLIFITISQNLFAQLSEVFPTDSAYWKIDYLCYDGGPNNIYYWTRTVNILEGDSVINNQTYIPYLYHSNPDSPTYIRIDSQKIYFKETHPNIDTTEYLAFDFGLEVGEKFAFPGWPWSDGDTVTIEAIDSVQFLDGIKRKRLKLNNPFQNICGAAEFWVEGIGAMPNPFYLYECFECSVSSFSFYQNGELVLFEQILDNEEIIQESAIEFYPNPFLDFIKINSPEIQIEELSVIDLTGKEVLRKKVQGKDFEIPVPSNLPSGIYFVNLKLENQKVVTRKMVKR